MAMNRVASRQLLAWVRTPLLLCSLLATGALARWQDAPTSVKRAGSCLTSGCHSDYLTARNLHPPVAAGVCKICHRPAGAQRHDFKLAREGGDLCSYCHWELVPEQNIHHRLGSGACVSCHDPHGTDHPFLLPAARIEDACEGCHPEILDASHLHTPVATGPCTVCHDPHATAPGHAADDVAQLCFQCHEATRDELAMLPHVHGPVQSESCHECHDPHGSDHAAQLRDGVPALCYGCHEEIRERLETSRHKHSVAGEPGGCMECHTPHASSVSAGLRSDPLTLCRSCHEHKITTATGETVAGFAHQVEARLYLHGPVRQRDCGACHNSHGSDHYRLLVGEYSPEFYARFDLDNFELCFSCHPQRGVLTERTTQLTEFRNGNLNLHYLHVNRPEKGRTCRACHATHGSDRPKHISDRIQFGSWELPIEFVKTPTGGSCESGCHLRTAYDRETPVDYGEVILPGEGNETPAEDRDEAPEERPAEPPSKTKGER
jgi:predicted CXXCH cytochrome family protein